MKKLFASASDFKARATDTDYEALLEYYVAASSADWEKEDCPYGFSRSFASKKLKEKWMLDSKESRDSKMTSEPLKILYKANANQKRKQCTFYLTEDTCQGLAKAYDEYNQIPKSVVAESIIRGALIYYGFIEE